MFGAYRVSAALAPCLLLLLCLGPAPAQGFCWQAGWNPGFNGKPTVEQVSIDTVRVSWEHIVKHRTCADQFLVKYWPRSSPHDYISSQLVKNTVNHIDVKVTPKIMYQFQAVAREDKGLIRGIDWNKSPTVDFKTSTYNREVAIDAVPPAYENPNSNDDGPSVESPGLASGDADPSTERSDRLSSQELHENIVDSGLDEGYRVNDTIRVAGMSIEMLVGLVVSGLVLLLILVGIIYKIATRNKKDVDLEEEGSAGNSSDSDEEEEEKQELAPEKNVS